MSQQKVDGELAVTSASRNGRAITLDPLAEHDVVMHARKVESSIGAGFRVGWISGKDETSDVEFDLTCGAGCGSKYLALHVKVDGRSVEEIVDISDVLQRWVTAVVERERGDEPDASPG